MRLLVLAAIFVFSGCAGLGLDKRATLMPDEFSISVDSNPEEDWSVDEVTGGLKWKLN